MVDDVKLPVVQTDAAVLPPLYARWMEQCLPKPIARETEATCDRCVMCSNDAPAGPSDRAFNPDVKCCTYHPTMPNYLVGTLLLSNSLGDRAGRDLVRNRIVSRTGVSPVGVAPPRDYALTYLHGQTVGFGRADTLRCPYFLEGTQSCGVWRHRTSTCATWYCKHDRGAAGYRSWMQIHGLLSCVENALALWCTLELGLDVHSLPAALNLAHERDAGSVELDEETLTRRMTDATYARLWGSWQSREEEWFRACAERVLQLSWDEVRTIGGAEVALRERLLLQAFEDLEDAPLPARLRVTAFQTSPGPDGRIRITTYSPYDPLDLLSELVPALYAFDGRPTDEVLRDFADRGIAIDEQTVRTLLDHDVLVAQE